MKAKHFLSQIDQPRVVAAIASAEKATSAEIRVWVSDRVRPDPVAAAQQRFGELGMNKTRHRNAVLIFVAPRSRTLAVVGDVAVHQECGEGFFREVRDDLVSHLRGERYTDGIVHAIEFAGRRLAVPFPADPGGHDPDELPNEIISD